MISLFGRTLSGRMLVAGVGRVDRCDDAAGPVLARRLAALPGVLAIDCGDRLEDFTGDIARAHPDIVIVADAVDFQSPPGSIALVEPEMLGTGPPDTHRATLRAAMDYLKGRTHAQVFLLAIQPGQVSDGVGLSREVAATVDLLVSLLAP